MYTDNFSKRVCECYTSEITKSFFYLSIWGYIKTKVFRYDKEYGLAKKFNFKRTCTIICEDISLLIRLFTGYLQIYVGCLNSIRRKINNWFLFRYGVGVSNWYIVSIGD